MLLSLAERFHWLHTKLLIRNNPTNKKRKSAFMSHKCLQHSEHHYSCLCAACVTCLSLPVLLFSHIHKGFLHFQVICLFACVFFLFVFLSCCVLHPLELLRHAGYPAFGMVWGGGGARKQKIASRCVVNMTNNYSETPLDTSQQSTAHMCHSALTLFKGVIPPEENVRLEAVESIFVSLMSKSVNTRPRPLRGELRARLCEQTVSSE